MSAIVAISEGLKAHLKAGLPNTTTVSLKDPSTSPSNAVSVWLYQVQPDEFTRNAKPPVIAESQGGFSKRTRSLVAPLGVNLYYLVTPLMESVESEQEMLARVMLRIHESPVVKVQQPPPGVDEEVRISLPADPLEERLRLWESLKVRPYRLSFVCLLRTVRLISSQTIDEAPVLSLTSVAAPEFSRS